MPKKRKSPTGRLTQSEPEIQVLPPERPRGKVIAHHKRGSVAVDGVKIRDVVISEAVMDKYGNLHIIVDEIIDICPACGSAHAGVCRMIGHTYPVKRLDDGKKNS